MKNKKMPISFLLFIIIYVVCHYTWILIWKDVQAIRSLGGNLFISTAALISSVWLLISYIKKKNIHNKWFLLFLFLGTMSYWIGMVIYTVYENVLNVQVPSPSYSDLFFVLQFVFFLLGFFWMISKQQKDYGLFKFFIDVSILMTVAFTFSHYYLIQPTIEKYGISDFDISVTLGPIGDLGLVFGAFILIYLSNYVREKQWIYFLILGLLSQIVADSIYSYSQLLTTYTSGSLIDPLYSSALLFVALAGHCFENPVPEPIINRIEFRSPRRKLSTILPFFAIALLLHFIFFNNQQNFIFVSGLFTAISFIFLRQYFILKENQLLLLNNLKKTKELAISEQHYRSLFDFNTDAVLSIDMDDKIQTVNSACVQILGYSKEETEGESIYSFCKKDEQAKLKQYMTIAKHGGTQVFEYTVESKTGRKLFISFTVTPIIVRGQITGVYLLGKDLTKNRLDQEKIAYLVYHDFLTGLPNRRMFEREIQHTFENLESNQILAIMYMDLDRFKLINDTFGHKIGDELIVEVSKRLNQVKRKDDVVARQEGDEFTYLVRGIVDTKEIEQIAIDILRAIHMPYKIKGYELHITISIGVAIFPYGGQSVESLMKNANLAMAKVKENGKNSYDIYQDEKDSVKSRQLTLEQDLYYAIERDELEVFYQPQIDINTGQIIGVEALARWNHPVFGMISPGEFIPIAEEIGLIDAIGQWVLEKSCLQVRRWHHLGHSLRLGVNLSPRQFYKNNLIRSVQSILRHTGFNPKFLDLEITEGIAMNNLDMVIPHLIEFRKMGIKISIDDFGTGYSSLAYLANFPFDTLKIAREFIKNVGNDSNAEAIISSIISLAKNLQLSLVAEGVETEEQAQFLIMKKCQTLQGFLYSKPVPAEELYMLLKNSSYLEITS